MSFLRNNPIIKSLLDEAGDVLLRSAASISAHADIKTIAQLKFIGELFYYLAPLRKKTLIDNLVKTGICDQAGNAQTELLIKKIYIAQTLNFFEFLWMSNLRSAAVIHKNFRFHGLHRLKNAMTGREGGIIISSHLGNWEMLAVILGRLGINLNVLTVERDIKIHKTVNKMREVTSNKMLDRNHAALKCMRLIKNNKFAGIMADQHTDNSGVQTRFFGINCMSTSLPAALSLKTDSPIIGIFMIRSADGCTHDIYIEEPLYTRDFVTIKDGAKNKSDSKNEAIVKCTQAVSDIIEKYIKIAPEQWFWFHKRWRA